MKRSCVLCKGTIQDGRGNAQRCSSCKDKPFPVSVTENRCTICKQTQPVKEFPVDGKHAKGIRSECYTCKRARNAKDRRRDPRQVLIWNSKARARKKSLQHTITLNDILIPETCPYLGIPIVVGKTKIHANSPTLDRIDSKKGYTPDNIEVISLRANNIKSDADHQTLRMIADRLEQITQ